MKTYTIVYYVIYTEIFAQWNKTLKFLEKKFVFVFNFNKNNDQFVSKRVAEFLNLSISALNTKNNCFTVVLQQRNN